MKKTRLIVSLLSLFILASCAPFLPDDNKVEETDTSEPIPTTTKEEHDPSKPFPIGIKVKQNKKEYVFSSKFNPSQDFEVEVSFNNGEKRNVSYTNNKRNGWYFVNISDSKGQNLKSLPETFNELTNYRVRIGATFNAKTVRYNKIFDLTVVGGSHSDIAPDTLTFENKRYNYLIGDTLSTVDIFVKATWNNYGGEEYINPGDGNNGYVISGIDFDISKPLTKVGSYDVKVTYRGLEARKTFKVIRFQPSEITYDYNDVTDDSVYAIDTMPTKGKSTALIVPIWFKDSNKFIKTQKEKDQIRHDIQLAYTGSKEETGWHSVRTYYLEDSYGQLDINGVVTDWFEVDYFGASVSQANTVEIVKQAAAWYQGQVSNEEWKKFDSDHNGFLDAVITIYAYPNHLSPLLSTPQEGNDNSNLWAYCFWVQDRHLQVVENPGPNQFFWASYDFLYHGLSEYNPMKIDGHTFIHEMGHVLGLVDYYDYNGLSTPAGGFSMQDSNVGGHDPFSKLAYGWIKPFVPTTSVSLTLKPFVESGDLILITPDFNNSPFDEYLLLEYYTPTGLNEFDSTYRYLDSYPFATQESGIRLWHVDARLNAFLFDDKGELNIDENNLYTRKPSDKENVAGVTLAMGNTTPAGTAMDAHASLLEKNQRYRLLSLLRQSESYNNNIYNFNYQFGHDSLWQQGDTFSMKEFENSFPNKGKLNSYKDLGFSFEVISQNESGISINITKQ